VRVDASFDAFVEARVGGTDTVHLRLAGVPQLDLWVDAGSYLPN